jgi:hypothetical protein
MVRQRNLIARVATVLDAVRTDRFMSSMDLDTQGSVDRSTGADIARRAGVTRTVRLSDGTEYTGLRPDILEYALKAASDLLRREQAAQGLEGPKIVTVVGADGT